MKEFVILNYGRAEPRKGIDILLRSVRLLLDQGINVKTYIASPVFYFHKFNEILDIYEELDLLTNIHFLHKIDEQQIQQLVNKSDLFVIPSRDYETFGLTIIESLSKGLPVVGTPTGAIPEILEKVDKNLIAKDLEPESLADSILWFYNLSEKDKNILSEKAIEVVKENYSQQAVEQQLLEVYEELLEK